MKLKSLLLSAIMAISTSANASVISLNITDWIGSGSQTGPFGTVTLNDNGGPNVSVLVTLNSNVGFVNTGAGYSLMWNLNSPSSITNLDSHFSQQIGSSFSKNGTTWDYAIQCNTPGACGQGGSSPYKGALSFTLTNISLSSFTENGKGYLFGTDICTNTTGSGCQGATGVAVVKQNDDDHNKSTTRVPEPMPLALFGITALMFASRNKKNK